MKRAVTIVGALTLVLVLLGGCVRTTHFTPLEGTFKLSLWFLRPSLEYDVASFRVAVFNAPGAADCNALVDEGLAPNVADAEVSFDWPAETAPELPPIPPGVQPAFFVEGLDAGGAVIARGCSAAEVPVTEGEELVVEVAMDFAGDDTAVCADVLELGLETANGTISETGEGRASCGGELGGEVAFKFTAPSEGLFTFEAEGGGVDPVLSLRASCATRSDELVCDAATFGRASVQTELTSGQALWIHLDSSGGAGTFSLTAAKDDRCDAPVEVFEGDTPLTLSGLSHHNPACSTRIQPEVFVEYRAAAAGIHVFELPDGNFSSSLSLRTACGVADSTVACVDGNDNPLSRSMDVGERIFVMVDASSDVTLRITRWDPLTTGTPMVTIPEGPFLMGSAEGVGQANERPQREIFVSAFEIDQHEVTRADYDACVNAGACPVININCNASPEPAEPQTCVDWYEADHYCRVHGKRLPTEAEWEKAARGGCEKWGIADCEPGTDDPLYPWGNEAPDCTVAAMSGCAEDVLFVGGRSPAGDSVYGVMDMAGNVDEWTSDCAGIYADDAPDYAEIDATDPENVVPGCGLYIVRGGGMYDAEGIRLAARGAGSASVGIHYAGFRCAR